MDKLWERSIWIRMTTQEYLTKDLNLSDAQFEAIMKLADVCGMKAMLEGGMASCFLNRKKKIEENNAKKEAEQKAAEEQRKLAMNTKVPVGHSDDFDSADDTDMLADVSDIMNADAQGDMGLMHSEDSDDNTELSIDQVTKGDIKNKSIDRETDIGVGDENADLLYLTARIGNMAHLDDNSIRKLMKTVSEQANQIDVSRDRISDNQLNDIIGTDISKSNTITGDVLTPLIEKIYGLNNYNSAVQLTNELDNYIHRNPNGQYTPILQAARKDPTTDSIKQRMSGSTANSDEWDKIVQMFNTASTSDPWNGSVSSQTGLSRDRMKQLKANAIKKLREMHKI